MKPPVGPTTDIRTATYDGALRTVFKEMSNSGSHAKTTSSAFGCGDNPAGSTDAVIVAAHCILKGQRKGIDMLVEKGGPDIILHLEMDPSPQKCTVVSDEVKALLSTVKNARLHEGRLGTSTRDICVIRIVIEVGGDVYVVFVSPSLMPDEFSGTLFHGMMTILEGLGLSIERLAAKFEQVVLHFAVDGSLTCELVLDFASFLANSSFPNVIILDKAICYMHNLNRVTQEYCERSTFKLEPYTSFAKLLTIGSHWDNFSSGVLKEAASEAKLEWHQWLAPPPEAKEQIDRVVALCFPNFKKTEETKETSCVSHGFSECQAQTRWQNRTPL